jgi:large subunit ribosomal protein L4e
MVKVYSLDGGSKGSVDVPKVFSTPLRVDLIQRTVLSDLAETRQAHRTDPLAGLRTSGAYFGSRRNRYRQTINKGMSRLPRLKTGGGGLGRVIRLPQTRGGLRAHASKRMEWARKINKKEYTLALNSAIAATADKKLLEERGHKVKCELPIVVEDKLAGLKKSSQVIEALGKMGLEGELASCKRRRLLIVVSEDKGILKAAANIPGVDVSVVMDLCVEALAPGTKPGMLTVWTEAAIKSLK